MCSVVVVVDNYKNKLATITNTISLFFVSFSINLYDVNIMRNIPTVYTVGYAYVDRLIESVISLKEGVNIIR